MSLIYRRNLGLSERQWEAMEEGEREVGAELEIDNYRNLIFNNLFT